MIEKDNTVKSDKLKLEANPVSDEKTEDISEQRIRSFIANISHEMRTPLNAIYGFSEIITQINADEETTAYARDIQSAAKNLLSIVNDLLDISKIESGTIELVPVPYYLHYLFSDVESVISLAAQNKGLLFKMDIDPELPSKLYGDIVRIRQILTNIVNNAVKYTREGSVILTADFEKPDENSDEIILVLSVKDTGIGIKPEHIDKIFDSFQQVDLKANRGIEGTGLGLAITKEFVALLGGEIKVESEYGVGSTFTVRIPQKVLDYTKLSTTIVKKNTDEKKELVFYAPSAEVLIVDDNPVNVRILKRLLRHYQIEADTAESGFEALDKLNKKNYDIIFMDHMMPEMDGVETIHRIRNLEDDVKKNTKVIAVSANAIRGIRDSFIQEGFDEYLSKPVDTKRLEKMLLTFLEDSNIVKEVENVKEDVNTSNIELEIPGIDVFSGLIKCDKNMDDYIEILKIVYESGSVKCEEIELFAKDKKYDNYRIAVHAVKSVGASIGAHKLFATAKVHELAAKNNQTEFIDGNYESVISEYRKVIDNIGKALSEKGLL